MAALSLLTVEEALKRLNNDLCMRCAEPFSKDGIITCPNCMEFKYCSTCCLEIDKFVHSFICEYIGPRCRNIQFQEDVPDVVQQCGRPLARVLDEDRNCRFSQLYTEANAIRESVRPFTVEQTDCIADTRRQETDSAAPLNLCTDINEQTSTQGVRNSGNSEKTTREPTKSDNQSTGSRSSLASVLAGGHFGCTVSDPSQEDLFILEHANSFRKGWWKAKRNLDRETTQRSIDTGGDPDSFGKGWWRAKRMFVTESTQKSTDATDDTDSFGKGWWRAERMLVSDSIQQSTDTRDGPDSFGKGWWKSRSKGKQTSTKSDGQCSRANAANKAIARVQKLEEIENANSAVHTVSPLPTDSILSTSSDDNVTSSEEAPFVMNYPTDLSTETSRSLCTVAEIVPGTGTVAKSASAENNSRSIARSTLSSSDSTNTVSVRVREGVYINVSISLPLLVSSSSAAYILVAESVISQPGTAPILPVPRTTVLALENALRSGNNAFVVIMNSSNVVANPFDSCAYDMSSFTFSSGMALSLSTAELISIDTQTRAIAGPPQCSPAAVITEVGSSDEYSKSDTSADSNTSTTAGSSPINAATAVAAKSTTILKTISSTTGIPTIVSSATPCIGSNDVISPGTTLTLTVIENPFTTSETKTLDYTSECALTSSNVNTTGSMETSSISSESMTFDNLSGPSMDARSQYMLPSQDCQMTDNVVETLVSARDALRLAAHGNQKTSSSPTTTNVTGPMCTSSTVTSSASCTKPSSSNTATFPNNKSDSESSSPEPDVPYEVRPSVHSPLGQRHVTKVNPIKMSSSSSSASHSSSSRASPCTNIMPGTNTPNTPTSSVPDSAVSSLSSLHVTCGGTGSTILSSGSSGSSPSSGVVASLSFTSESVAGFDRRPSDDYSLQSPVNSREPSPSESQETSTLSKFTTNTSHEPIPDQCASRERSNSSGSASVHDTSTETICADDLILLPISDAGVPVGEAGDAACSTEDVLESYLTVQFAASLQLTPINPGHSPTASGDVFPVSTGYATDCSRRSDIEANSGSDRAQTSDLVSTCNSSEAKCTDTAGQFTTDGPHCEIKAEEKDDGKGACSRDINPPEAVSSEVIKMKGISRAKARRLARKKAKSLKDSKIQDDSATVDDDPSQSHSVGPESEVFGQKPEPDVTAQSKSDTAQRPSGSPSYDSSKVTDGESISSSKLSDVIPKSTSTETPADFTPVKTKTPLVLQKGIAPLDAQQKDNKTISDPAKSDARFKTVVENTIDSVQASGARPKTTSYEASGARPKTTSSQTSGAKPITTKTKRGIKINRPATPIATNTNPASSDSETPGALEQETSFIENDWTPSGTTMRAITQLLQLMLPGFNISFDDVSSFRDTAIAVSHLRSAGIGTGNKILDIIFNDCLAKIADCGFIEQGYYAGQAEPPSNSRHGERFSDLLAEAVNRLSEFTSNPNLNQDPPGYAECLPTGGVDSVQLCHNFLIPPSDTTPTTSAPDLQQLFNPPLDETLSATPPSMQDSHTQDPDTTGTASTTGMQNIPAADDDGPQLTAKQRRRQRKRQRQKEKKKSDGFTDPCKDDGGDKAEGGESQDESGGALTLSNIVPEPNESQHESGAQDRTARDEGGIGQACAQIINRPCTCPGTGEVTEAGAEGGLDQQMWRKFKIPPTFVGGPFGPTEDCTCERCEADRGRASGTGRMRNFQKAQEFWYAVHKKVVADETSSELARRMSKFLGVRTFRVCSGVVKREEDQERDFEFAFHRGQWTSSESSRPVFFNMLVEIVGPSDRLVNGLIVEDAASVVRSVVFCDSLVGSLAGGFYIFSPGQFLALCRVQWRRWIDRTPIIFIFDPRQFRIATFS